MYKIEPMTPEYAEMVSQWVYPSPYSIYSFKKDDETISELMNSEYFICKDEQNNIIGYFCFGVSAQIPTNEKDVYNTGILDIGLGLRPDLCGRGLGLSFIQAGMDYGRQFLHAEELRLTVASFNKRAIALYKKAGFSEVSKVTHRITNKEFIVMRCTL